MNLCVHFQGSIFRGENVSFSEGVLLLYVGVVLFPWKSFLQSDKMVVPSLDDDNSLLKILVKLINKLVSKMVIVDLLGFYHGCFI